MSVVIILGVVASIVIPSTIRKHQRQETMARLKIAYNMLVKLTEESRIYNGGIPSGNNHWSDAEWNRYVRPYLDVAHDCGLDYSWGAKPPRDTSCFAGPEGGWYTPDGIAFPTYDAAYGTDAFHKVILKNGMSLAFHACSACASSHNIFVVDINGPNKGYSKMGQDVFVFEWANPTSMHTSCRYSGISRSPTPQLVPYVEPCAYWNQGGWYRDPKPTGTMSNNCRGASGSGNMGWGAKGSMCAAWIINNNWQFPRNYPWNIVNRTPNGFRRPR